MQFVFILLLSALCAVIAESEIVFLKSLKSQNHTRPRNPVLSVHVRSPVDCALQCLKRSDCVLHFYSAVTGQCELTDSDSPAVKDEAGWVRSDLTAGSRVTPPSTTAPPVTTTVGNALPGSNLMVGNTCNDFTSNGSKFECHMIDYNNVTGSSLNPVDFGGQQLPQGMWKGDSVKWTISLDLPEPPLNAALRVRVDIKPCAGQASNGFNFKIEYNLKSTQGLGTLSATTGLQTMLDNQIISFVYPYFTNLIVVGEARRDQLQIDVTCWDSSPESDFTLCANGIIVQYIDDPNLNG